MTRHEIPLNVLSWPANNDPAETQPTHRSASMPNRETSRNMRVVDLDPRDESPKILIVVCGDKVQVLRQRIVKAGCA